MGQAVGMTDTHGLSRKEHVVAKLENREALNMEERGWIMELLSPQERDALGYDPKVPPGMTPRAAELYDLTSQRERHG